MRKLCLLVLASILPVVAFAQEGKEGWQVELRRIALNLTSTQVKNAEKYQGFPDARLSSSDQSLILGDLDFFAGLYMPRGLWSNTLTAQYGKTRVRSADGSEIVTSKSADIILFTTDYAFTLWTVEEFLGGFSAGPFVNAEYETQFTTNDGVNRRKISRGRGGLKLFKGRYIQDFYVAGVYEYDLTFNPASSNFAWETGIRAEYNVREGVKAVFDAYFRDYVSYSESRFTNLDYEAGANARLDVLVWENFAVAPVISYFAAQAKEFSGLGQNLFVGVSFSWSRVIREAKSR